MKIFKYTQENSLNSFFKERASLQIKQNIMTTKGSSNWFKYINYEVPNNYDIKEQDGIIGSISEQTEGVIPFSLKNMILRYNRPARFVVKDDQENTILHLYRPLRFILSKMIVKDSRGRLLGRVLQKFSLTHKIYELWTTGPKPFCIIKSPRLIKITSFPAVNRSGQRLGEIKKEWGGIKTEALSFVDRFSVQFKDVSVEQKAVMFSAVIGVDFDHFEATFS